MHKRKTHHAYNMKECVFLFMLIERTVISKLAIKTIVWLDTTSGEEPTNTFLYLTCVSRLCLCFNHKFIQ